MSEHPHIELGRHSLPVYPQPPQRVIRRLGRLRDTFAGAVTSDGPDVVALVEGLGDELYFAIETFVPNIRDRYPEHEFKGFPTQAAFDADEYSESQNTVTGDELDQHSLSPTMPQYFDMADTIIEVNGGKRFLDLLGKVIELPALKPELTAQLLEYMERQSGSRSLPGGNGTSPPMSSGPSDPTPAELDTSESVAADESSGTTPSD